MPAARVISENPIERFHSFLHNRRMILLFAFAHFAHHVITALIVPMLPYIRDDFGLSYTQIGVVSAAFTIAYGVSQLPTGWLSDHLGPRKLLLIGISGVGLIGAFVGLANSYWAIIVIFLFLGIAGGGYHPSASAIISSRVPPVRRGRALGIHIIGGSTSYFLAPLIAAGLVGLVGWRGSFVSLSIPVFILGIALFFLLHRHTGGLVRSDGSTDGTSAPENQEVQSLKPLSHIITFLILTGLTWALATSTISFIPLLLVDQFGTSSELASALLAIIYSSGFCAAPLGGYISDRIGQSKTMIAVGLLFGPVVIGMYLAPSLIVFCIGLFLFGVLMFVRMPTSESYIAHAVPIRLRSTVLGIYFFSGMEGAALFTPFMGAIIDAKGFGFGFFVSGISVLVIALVCSVLLMVFDRSPKRSAESTRA